MQNLLVLRFSNNIFERLWGSRNVYDVQITVAEAEGVGSRATFYDCAGALRDMVQNHILQTLSLLTMEAPVSLDARAITDAKLNVLRTIRPLRRRMRARIRCGRGTARVSTPTASRWPVTWMNRASPDNSRAETFVALKTYIDNWRWSNCRFSSGWASG